MKVLIVTAGYPTLYNPLDGIFHKDQVQALTLMHKVGVIAVSAVSIKHVIKAKKLAFGLKKYKECNVSTYHYTCINKPLDLEYSVKKTWRVGKKILKKYLAENELPDIVHLQSFEAVLLAKYIKDKYRIPFVITEHSSRFNNNTLPYNLKKYAELAFTESIANITVSEELAEKLKHNYNKHFHYIPNVIDTDFFVPGKEIKNDFTLINVAGLVDIKNHALLIDALKILVNKIKNIKLIIIGDGELKNNLINTVNKYGLNKQVLFKSYLSRKEIVKYLQQAHCYVQSSKSETFGIALVEALSCGLPVISTTSSGPKSIIKDNNIGLLSEHNAEDLAEKIYHVYKNYSNYNSTYIRNYAIDNFSKLAVCKSISNIYQQSL